MQPPKCGAVAPHTGVSTLLHTLDAPEPSQLCVRAPTRDPRLYQGVVHLPSGNNCSKPRERAGEVFTRIRQTRNLEVGGTCKREKKKRARGTTKNNTFGKDQTSERQFFPRPLNTKFLDSIFEHFQRRLTVHVDATKRYTFQHVHDHFRHDCVCVW